MPFSPATIAKRNSRWEEMFAELVAFKAKHGHCNVPGRSKGEYHSLCVWVYTQRQVYRSDRHHQLLPERRKRLEDLGFVWQLNETMWEDGYSQLEAFKKKHGHCNVPSLSKEYASLHGWIKSQRHAFKIKRLAPDREKRLVALGLVLTPEFAQKRWEEMLEELVAYKKWHGHCLVPTGPGPLAQLALWTDTQRIYHRRGLLSADRIKRLLALGFMWSRYEAQWEINFRKLESFQKKHGHCRVLLSHDPSLSSWLGTQRQARKKRTITAEHVRRLDAIGFEWKPQPIATGQKHLAEFRGFRPGHRSILTDVQIARASSLVAKGKPVGTVAKKLGCHPQTVHRALLVFKHSRDASRHQASPREGSSLVQRACG